MGMTQTDEETAEGAAAGTDTEQDSEGGAPTTEAAPAPSEAPTASDQSTAPVGVNRAELERILEVSVPVTVMLAEQSVPLQKVLEFKPGSIIEFDQPFDADLALMVGNRRIGVGKAVKAGEHFGLRISRIGRINETIRALGEFRQGNQDP
jgi:flagellar motor switch protein FliN/FliY